MRTSILYIEIYINNYNSPKHFQKPLQYIVEATKQFNLQ